MAETPEERVRQAYVVTLHNEYGFGLDQMDEELQVAGRGSARARGLVYQTVRGAGQSLGVNDKGLAGNDLLSAN